MRLIDADQFLKDNDFLFEKKSPQEKRNALATPILLSEFLDMIDDAPTMEIKAVTHGYWIIDFPYGPDYGRNFSCSECGHMQWARSRYCSHCGATMDEGCRIQDKDLKSNENTEEESGR